MKKLLYTTLLFGFVGSHILYADTVTVTSTVLPSAVVGFADVSGEVLNANDRFIDATVDLGVTELNTPFATVTNNFYVKSNNPNGVQISITPQAGEDTSGGLKSTLGELIPVQYFINGFTPYNMLSSPLLTLTSVATDGTIAGLPFNLVPNISGTQVAGVYDTVFDVTITTP